MSHGDIGAEKLAELKTAFEPLIGLRLSWLQLPPASLPGFEPSQVAVIVNTLADAALPQIELLAQDPENAERLIAIGLKKAQGQIGDREGYPDYVHVSGCRVELKGLFVDNPALKLKRPPTRREPSARIKENVRVQDVDAGNDALLLVAIQLQEVEGLCTPVIVDVAVMSMIECVRARDDRLLVAGRWHGKIPQVVKKASLWKLGAKQPLGDSDFEKDTNFGKLKRIPYAPLSEFLKKHRVNPEQEEEEPEEPDEGNEAV